MARINDQNDVPTIRKPQCRSSTCHQDGAARSVTYLYRLMTTRQSCCILVTRGLIKVKENIDKDQCPRTCPSLLARTCSVCPRLFVPANFPSFRSLQPSYPRGRAMDLQNGSALHLPEMNFPRSMFR